MRHNFIKELKIRLVQKIISFILSDIKKLSTKNTSLSMASPNSPKSIRVPKVIATDGYGGRHKLKMLLSIPYLLKTIVSFTHHV